MDAQHDKDVLNPVFFKELRQARRNHFLLGVGLVMLLIEGFIAFVFYRYGTEAKDADALAGTAAVYCFFTLLCVGAGGLVPVSAMAQERRVEGLDPLLGTCLTPWQVLSGKFLAILVGMGVPMALSMPMWLFLRPYFHHFGFVAVFGLEFLAVLAALVVSCYREGAMNTARNWGVIAFLAVWPIAVVMGTCFVKHDEVVIHWNEQVVSLAAGVSVMVILLALAYGALCHRQQERTRGLRIALVLLDLAWLPLTGWVNDWQWRDAWMCWGGLTVVAAGCLLFLSSFERPLPSRRQAEETPRNLFLRLLVFPWCTGAAGGIVLSTILAVAGSMVFAVAKQGRDDGLLLTLFFCFGLVYAGIAQAFRRWLRVHPVVTYVGIVALIALLNMALLPFEVKGALFLTPFFVLEYSFQSYLEPAVLVVGTIGIALNFFFWCDFLDHLTGSREGRKSIAD